jgi:hypothetical protein
VNIPGIRQRSLASKRIRAAAAVGCWLFVLVRPVDAASGLPSALVPAAGPVAASRGGALKQGPLRVVRDVALRPGGVFEGEVLAARDPAGGEVAGLPLSLFEGRQTVARTSTDARGRFAFRDLSGGLYRMVVETPDGPHSRFFRLWSFGTAPPQARDRADVLMGRPLARGQSPDWSPPGFPRGAVITALAAGAIAPPIIYQSVKRDRDIPASP